MNIVSREKVDHDLLSRFNCQFNQSISFILHFTPFHLFKNDLSHQYCNLKEPFKSKLWLPLKSKVNLL